MKVQVDEAEIMTACMGRLLWRGESEKCISVAAATVAAVVDMVDLDTVKMKTRDDVLAVIMECADQVRAEK